MCQQLNEKKPVATIGLMILITVKQLKLGCHILFIHTFTFLHFELTYLQRSRQALKKQHSAENANEHRKNFNFGTNHSC